MIEYQYKLIRKNIFSKLEGCQLNVAKNLISDKEAELYLPFFFINISRQIGPHFWF